MERNTLNGFYLASKRLVLLNVLVWISPKSLYETTWFISKFWEPQYMRIKETLNLLKILYLSNDSTVAFQILEAFNDQVLQW